MKLKKHVMVFALLQLSHKMCQ